MLNAIHAGSGRAEPVPYGELALEAYTGLGNLPRQGHCLNNLAVQAFGAGRWKEALTSYRQAEDIFRRIGDTAAELEERLGEEPGEPELEEIRELVDSLVDLCRRVRAD